MDNNENIENLGILIDLFSLIIGLINLDLNTQQSNDLDSHLQKQDNEFLRKIVQQNEEIILLEKEIIKLLTKDGTSGTIGL